MKKVIKKVCALVFLVSFHSALSMNGIKDGALSLVKRIPKCALKSGISGAFSGSVGFLAGRLSKTSSVSEENIMKFKKVGFDDGVEKTKTEFTKKLEKVLPVLVVESQLDIQWDNKLAKKILELSDKIKYQSNLLELKKSGDKASEKYKHLLSEVEKNYIKKDLYEGLEKKHKKFKRKHEVLGVDHLSLQLELNDYKTGKHYKKAKKTAALQVRQEFTLKLGKILPTLMREKNLRDGWEEKLKKEIEEYEFGQTRVGEILGIENEKVTRDSYDKLMLKCEYEEFRKKVNEKYMLLTDVIHNYVLKKDHNKFKKDADEKYEELKQESIKFIDDAKEETEVEYARGVSETEGKYKDLKNDCSTLRMQLDDQKKKAPKEYARGIEETENKYTQQLSEFSEHVYGYDGKLNKSWGSKVRKNFSDHTKLVSNLHTLLQSNTNEPMPINWTKMLELKKMFRKNKRGFGKRKGIFGNRKRK